MQRFVGREVGLGGLEELLDDRDEVMRSPPSEPPLSIALAVGFDFLDQFLNFRFAVVGRGFLIDRHNRPLGFSTPGFDLFDDLRRDTATVRKSFSHHVPITSIVGGEADSPQPIPQSIDLGFFHQTEKTLNASTARRTEIRSWWTYSTSSSLFSAARGSDWQAALRRVARTWLATSHTGRSGETLAVHLPSVGTAVRSASRSACSVMAAFSLTRRWGKFRAIDRFLRPAPLVNR